MAYKKKRRFQEIPGAMVGVGSWTPLLTPKKRVVHHPTLPARRSNASLRPVRLDPLGITAPPRPVTAPAPTADATRVVLSCFLMTSGW